MGTQKNRLNETVLLSTQNIFLKLRVSKYLQFYADIVNVVVFLCRNLVGYTKEVKYRKEDTIV